MKKRFFALFLTMALLLPAVLLSGCASADSGIMDTANLNATAAGGDSSLPVVTWKMGSVWGAGNVHFTVDQRFAELVSQLMQGSLLGRNGLVGVGDGDVWFGLTEDDTIRLFTLQTPHGWSVRPEQTGVTAS